MPQTAPGEKADCTVSVRFQTEPSLAEQLAIFYPGSLPLIKNSFTMIKIGRGKASLTHPKFSYMAGCSVMAERRKGDQY